MYWTPRAQPPTFSAMNPGSWSNKGEWERKPWNTMHILHYIQHFRLPKSPSIDNGSFYENLPAKRSWFVDIREIIVNIEFSIIFSINVFESVGCLSKAFQQAVVGVVGVGHFASLLFFYNEKALLKHFHLNMIKISSLTFSHVEHRPQMNRILVLRPQLSYPMLPIKKNCDDFPMLKWLRISVSVCYWPSGNFNFVKKRLYI